MAHMLEEYGGRASMAYVGRTPWHNLGEQMPEGATVTEWFTQSRLNYPVKVASAFARLSPDHPMLPSDKFRFLVREDTGAILGSCTTKYSLAQNSELAALASIFHADGRVTVESAGVLGKGERVWMAMKWKEPLIIGANDVVVPYLYLTNSHDGKSAMNVGNSTVRIVCMNTLNLAIKKSQQKFSITHTGNTHQKMLLVAATLGSSAKAMSEFSECASCLHSQCVGVKETEDFFNELVPSNSTRAKNVKSDLLRVFESAPGHETTKWGLVNAVSYYTDHLRSTRGGYNGRLTSALFGSGAALKQQAFALLVS